MYTKCVYTVPLTVVGTEFPSEISSSSYMRNGVYKMCVHRSSNCSRYSISFKISYSSYMRNGVYKMCVHRSSNCSRYRISFKISYCSYMRNGVYKMLETVPLTVVGMAFPLI